MYHINSAPERESTIMLSETVRDDFEFFRNNGGLAYLDNAATAQRPDAVLKAVSDYYQTVNSNPLRGLYQISLEATGQYEQARKKVADFIGAGRAEEIIFTKNATESLNLVAYSLCDAVLQPGDEMLVGIMEHHSNMLPWRAAAKRHGASVRYLECDMDGLITAERFEEALTEKTKIVAVTHVSNVFGRENDIKTFARICHDKGIVIVADGSQSVPHMKVDVRDLDVDFLAFSGHKMCGPMGIGVLYGRYDLLEKIPPFLTGGEMIEIVTLDKITYAEIPHRFEAGTVNAGGAIGLKAAIEYYEKLGMEDIEEREAELTEYAFDKLDHIDGIRIMGSRDPREHHGILTFTLQDVHPHDIAYILDEQANVAIRAGHHCAQPLLKFLGTPSTARASLAFYNTEEEVDRLAACLSGMREQMGFAGSL